MITPNSNRHKKLIRKQKTTARKINRSCTTILSKSKLILSRPIETRRGTPFNIIFSQETDLLMANQHNPDGLRSLCARNLQAWSYRRSSVRDFVRWTSSVGKGDLSSWYKILANPISTLPATSSVVGRERTSERYLMRDAWRKQLTVHQ